MFSQELNQLIEAAVEDGIITDKEREVLRKRGLQEGADPDELDMIIDAKLAKKKRESRPSTSKQGVVKKCPSCGAPVEGGSVKCSLCGHVFMGLESNKSSEALAAKLVEVDEKFRDRKDISEFDGLTQEEKADKEKATIIANFPVPTTKEDLLEFIPSMRAKWKNSESASGRYNAEKKAYMAKYDECMLKARALFPTDPDFKPLFDSDSKDTKFGRWYSQLSPYKRQKLHAIFGFVLWAFFMMMLMVILFVIGQKYDLL